MIVFHHAADDFFAANQYDHAFGPGHGGIKQVTGQQHGRTAGDRHDHHREFTALGFVNGKTVGGFQRIQITGFIFHLPFFIKQITPPGAEL